MNNKLNILLIVGVLLGVGCSKNTEDLTVGPDTGGEENPTESISYASDVQPIFNGSCTGCHGSSGGVNLSSYAQLLSSSGNDYGDQLVVPGNAAASGLVDKLEPNPTHGSRMPIGGALSSSEIQTISAWINQGAQNN